MLDQLLPNTHQPLSLVDLSLSACARHRDSPSWTRLPDRLSNKLSERAINSDELLNALLRKLQPYVALFSYDKEHTQELTILYSKALYKAHYHGAKPPSFKILLRALQKITKLTNHLPQEPDALNYKQAAIKMCRAIALDVLHYNHLSQGDTRSYQQFIDDHIDQRKL